MATITKYAGTISQTTGGKYAQFSNLANMKNNVGGSWSTTETIKGKSGSPNRPSTLSFTHFGFNLPTGAEVSKVTITYSHRKTGSCTIGAPTISLLGVSGFSGKGVAPSKTTVTSNTKVFKGSALTRTVVNSSSFGVKVNYPTNSGAGEGTISVAYVRITVEYKVPSYSLSIKRVSGGYNNERYTIQCAISNKNLTAYSPTLTLTAPTGFSFERARGSGSYTRVNARTIAWNPKLSKSIGTASLDLEFSVNVTYPVGTDTYTGTFTLVESLYSGTKSLSATITERPTESSETDPDAPLIIDDEEASIQNPKIQNVKVGEVFQLGINTSDWSLEDHNTYGFYGFFDLQFEKYPDDYGNNDFAGEKLYYSLSGSPDVWDPSDHQWLFYPEDYEEGFLNINFKATAAGDYVIILFHNAVDAQASNNVPIKWVKISVKPDESDLSTPFFTVLEPSEEEMNRLGSGYTYIAQADIQHTTEDTYNRDWYKNNRIGVFNGPIANDTTEEDIFENTTYWSKATGGLNTYENCECEFTYDSQYPLYILITGDYPEAETYGYDMGTIKYDTP